MSILMHLADRVLNRPLLITPEKAQVVLSVLGNRIGVSEPTADRFEGDRLERDETGNIVVGPHGETNRAPYRNKNGVAIISVVGSLVNRGAYVGASSGVVSYEGVKHQLKHARTNSGIQKVILDLQSPGGEAVGAFETAEQVRLLAGDKHTVAVVNGMAASAAYAIASGASEIVTTETGVSGSIGVVLLHADFSVHLAKEGIKPTLIFAGAHKVDGNPFEPLSDTVRSDLQAEITAFYELFLETVAVGRGARLTADMARATEARTLIGAQAVEMGLADRVGTFESVLSELTGARGGRSTSLTRRTSMNENQGAPGAELEPGISQSAHDKAVVAAKTAGMAEGAQAERDRIGAIVADEKIEGKVGAAIDLALKSPDMSAENVASFVSEHMGDAPGATATDYLQQKTAANGAPIFEGGLGAEQQSGKQTWADFRAKRAG